jgi:hypothetical protein
MESSRCPQPKIPSPTSSATSKGEPKVSQVNEGMTNIQEIAAEKKEVSATQQVSEQVQIARAAVVSEATHESMSVKEPTSQGSAKLVEEEVQQKLVPTDGGNVECVYNYAFFVDFLLRAFVILFINFAGKKKKKKKVCMPANGKYSVFFVLVLPYIMLEHLVNQGNTLVFSQVITLNSLYLSCRFTM